MKTAYKVMIGNEVTVQQGLSRNEAIELYEELHADWLEKWAEDYQRIETEQAQSERPWLIYSV